MHKLYSRIVYESSKMNTCICCMLLASFSIIVHNVLEMHNPIREYTIARCFYAFTYLYILLTYLMLLLVYYYSNYIISTTTFHCIAD